MYTASTYTCTYFGIFNVYFPVLNSILKHGIHRPTWELIGNTIKFHYSLRLKLFVFIIHLNLLYYHKTNSGHSIIL